MGYGARYFEIFIQQKHHLPCTTTTLSVSRLQRQHSKSKHPTMLLSPSTGSSSASAANVSLVIVVICVLLSTSDTLEDPVSNMCTQINKYLASSYGCRPNEFRRRIACQDNRIELRCPRPTQIAIHSASYGWSDRLTAPDSCPLATGYDRDCPRTCALEEVRRRCQGKRRCLLDDGIVVDSSRCPPGSIKYLGVIYTCVKKSLLNHIVSSDTIYVNPCDEEASAEDSEPGRPHPPFMAFPSTVASAFRSGRMRTDSAVNDEDQALPQGDDVRDVDQVLIRNDEPRNPRVNTFSWNERPSSTQGRALREGFVRNGSGVNEGLRMQTVRSGVQVKQVVASTQTPSIWMHSLMDWVWIWNYIKENKEKFVLYVLLGLSLGTIAVLFASLCHMIFCTRRSPSKEAPSSGNPQQGTMASCNSPTWRMPESESSTGDDRTLHDDDVELTSFNHIDSLQRRANYHQTGGVRPPSYTSRPQSPTATTTTATINRTYSHANPVVTRCFTPSPPTMTLPETSVANGGFLPPTPLMSNGRVEMTPLPQPHCVGSLGRTYSNHYRRDSYQLDPAPGCRTLQPIQHYYG